MDEPDESNRLTPVEEEEAITELALTQLAQRAGANARPEDFVIRRVDPGSAEAMRDGALQQFLQRKAEIDRQRQQQALAARSAPAAEPASGRAKSSGSKAKSSSAKTPKASTSKAKSSGGTAKKTASKSKATAKKTTAKKAATAKNAKTTKGKKT